MFIVGILAKTQTQRYTNFFFCSANCYFSCILSSLFRHTYVRIYFVNVQWLSKVRIGKIFLQGREHSAWLFSKDKLSNAINKNKKLFGTKKKLKHWACVSCLFFNILKSMFFLNVKHKIFSGIVASFFVCDMSESNSSFNF